MAAVLRQVRGLAPATVVQHSTAAAEFLAQLGCFGHSDPSFVVPYGVEAGLDCDQRQFPLLETLTLL